MTLNELIERLEEYRETMGEDVEVRLMTQLSWPFENSIVGVCSGAEINDGEDDDSDAENDRVLYIVEGQQLGYGTKRAWDVAY